MERTHAPLLCALVIASITAACAHTSVKQEASASGDSEGANVAKRKELLPHKVELYDGVYMKIPRNGTNTVVSFEIDTKKGVEGRSKQKKLMERILPMFIMPFLIQSTIVPMFLSSLKFMLLKSMMVGKLALLLIFINAFKNNNNVKGRDSVMADTHYGYHGNMEEYGAYVN